MPISLAYVGNCSEGRLQNIYSSIGERETDRLVSDLCTEEGFVTEEQCLVPDALSLY
jgi:hypothetical protein